MMFLIQMRADLLQVLRKDLLSGAEVAALRSLDHSLKVSMIIIRNRQRLSFVCSISFRFGLA
jgi:hypothetical protein